MKINTKHQTHGAALAQIVEHESFTALNKATDKRGHYQVNHDRRLLTKKAGGDGDEWRFTFTADDLAVLEDDLDNGVHTFICLVCGDKTICALGEDDFRQILDITSGNPQSVVVETPAGRSMRVRGTQGELARKVPHNAFPDVIF